MIIYPNAKINIGLNITSKRADGFHTIESVFYPIPWCDVLEINKAEQFKFTSSGLTIDGALENNLIVRAFKLMQTKFNIGNCHIHLHKQIPMGAGLGGGSADASFTLTALNTIFDLKLSTKELVSMSDSLGSDCPFFIENTPKFVTGKGEIMTSIDLDLSGYYIKLVNPKIHISTQKAFSGIKPKTSSNNLSQLSLTSIKENNSHIKNDFELSVFPEYPILQRIKNDLKNEGAIYASMTGTGSTIYGIFKEEPILSFNEFIEKIIKL